MTHLTIRQKKSFYNQQGISNIISSYTKTQFLIKRKGKHCFYITFKERVSNNLANTLAAKLGLSVSYSSDVRCILSDYYDITTL